MATKVTLVQLLDSCIKTCQHEGCEQPGRYLAQVRGGKAAFLLCEQHAQACREKGIVHNEENTVAGVT